MGCGDDDNPSLVPGENIAPNSPAARQEFFNEFIASKEWRLSRFVFDDTARFFRDSTLYKNLYDSLRPCRENITYEWWASPAFVNIRFNDSQPCSPNEPRTLNEGLSLAYTDNSFLMSGEAAFDNWNAVNKFLDLNVGGPGITGWNEYDMEWDSIVLTKDSINVEGSFSNLNRNVPLPNFRLQFVPI